MDNESLSSGLLVFKSRSDSLDMRQLPSVQGVRPTRRYLDTHMEPSSRPNTAIKRSQRNPDSRNKNVEI
jgi:hypothetical protein